MSVRTALQAAYDRIMGRRRAYRALFLGGPNGRLNPNAEVVLADLVRFARVHGSTYRVDAQGRADPIAMAYAEGRREVALRILAHLHVSDADLVRMQETDRSNEDDR